MKRLRVLVLVHPELVPPDSLKGHSEQEINEWKTEYDVVSTLRGARSQWVRNLRARREVRYWLGGRARRGRARLFAPGAPPPPTDGLPPFARAVADALLPPATLFGWTFAVIGPD